MTDDATIDEQVEPHVFWAIRNTHEGVDSYFAETDDGWTWVPKATDATEFATRDQAHERLKMLSSRYSAHVYVTVRVTKWNRRSTPPAPDAVTDCQPKPSEGWVSEKRMREIRFWHANIAPACSQDYVGDLLREVDRLRATINRQKGEIDRLAGSLAACGVIAGCDDVESKERWILEKDNRYWTDSYGAVTNRIFQLEADLKRVRILNEDVAAENERLEADLAAARLDAERCRQWFDAVQDLNHDFLDRDDCVLARKLYEQCGMRVPKSIEIAIAAGDGK